MFFLNGLIYISKVFLNCQCINNVETLSFTDLHTQFAQICFKILSRCCSPKLIEH